MKDNETDYLDKLFSTSSDVSDEAEVGFPLVEVPEGLGNKLHAIVDSAPAGVSPTEQRGVNRWSVITSVAASLFIAIVGFQFYQQQQTLKQLEQAQADLATALHYLGEANRITRAQVRSSLNTNLKKNEIEPAIEFEWDGVIPRQRESKPETRKPNRTL